MNRRSWLLLLLFFIVISIVAIVVHEAAHVIAALILGVPFNEIEIGFYGISPSVNIPERFINSNLTLYHWGGGITASILLLSTYFLLWFRRYRRTPSPMNSMLGLITIVLACFQLSQGYIEGRFHHAYITLAGSIDNPLNLIYLFAVIASIFIHFTLFPMSKIKEKG